MLKLGTFLLALGSASATFSYLWDGILCPPVCPEGFFGFETKCYVIPRITQTWGDAYEFCRTFDSNILRVETTKEQTFLESVLHDHEGNDFWIGATDLSYEGDWRWATTNGPVVSKWWMHREPDNRINREGHRQHCAVLSDRVGYKWSDDDCLQHFHFICERHIV
ncbi:hypothetical protein SNE40_009483 [Patella caerulea]|uniref:C-type lectin domain-containing protein n=1 Tax=Patella caerulea TaxID=87958 RepID=A0AAN8JTL0_PATCE